VNPISVLVVTAAFAGMQVSNLPPAAAAGVPRSIA
jgi:hypothetical protein